MLIFIKYNRITKCKIFILYTIAIIYTFVIKNMGKCVPFSCIVGVNWVAIMDVLYLNSMIVYQFINIVFEKNSERRLSISLYH